jgi:hypothetical protein
LCEPLETTANGKRLVVEDSAACQKTIQTPASQQVLKTDNGNNLTWTSGTNGTILGKDSSGYVEFATLNSVLQAGPVDLGSQPLETIGAINATSVNATSITATGTGSFKSVSVINTGTGNGISIQTVDGTPLSIQSNNTTPIKGGSLKIFDPTLGDFVFNGGNDGIFTFANTSLATTRATVFSGSNVGINTSTPSATLDVAGGINSHGLFVNNPSGDSSIEVGGNANVFIDLKKPNSDDYDLRIITDGTNSAILSSGSITITPATKFRIQNIPVYADNTAALAGGLIADDVYKTSIGDLRIVY